jgi:hypothetical protein
MKPKFIANGGEKKRRGSRGSSGRRAGEEMGEKGVEEASFEPGVARCQE